MMYMVLFSYSKDEVEGLIGDALAQYIAKSLEEAEERALREMREYGWPFALIFILDPEPVKLSLLSLEDETIKALGRWF